MTRERVPDRPTAVLVVLGIVLRLVRYLDGRSLWNDEAQLALNVVSRSGLELLAPLDYGQAAAPLFLWLVRGCAVVFGALSGLVPAWRMARLHPVDALRGGAR